MTRWQRFWIYGAAGVFSEVVQTSLKAPLRDKNLRLTGHSYLWMLPIYGTAAILFEPAHDRLREQPAVVRGAAYTAGIFAIEAASGTVLKKTIGEIPWDYARPRGSRPEPTHFKGLVRPLYAPIWFTVGMCMEKLHDVLVPRDPR